MADKSYAERVKDEIEAANTVLVQAQRSRAALRKQAVEADNAVIAAQLQVDTLTNMLIAALERAYRATL